MLNVQEVVDLYCCNCLGTPVGQPEEFHVQGVEGAKGAP